LEDAGGDCDGAGLEIYLEEIIEPVWSYALGGHDGANLDAVVEQVWR